MRCSNDEIRTPNDNGMTKPKKPRSPNGQRDLRVNSARFFVQMAALWRDAVGECVGMEISVLAQLVPWTVFLGSLRDTIFLTRGEIFP